MQIKSAPSDCLELSYYLRKSYYKTSSLICDACKSCVILGGHAEGSDLAGAAKRFGFHFGLAYQIIDDILDFTGSAEDLGKPAMADVRVLVSRFYLPYPPPLFFSHQNPRPLDNECR